MGVEGKGAGTRRVLRKGGQQNLIIDVVRTLSFLVIL
jgi:hypothetical protein